MQATFQALREAGLRQKYLFDLMKGTASWAEARTLRSFLRDREGEMCPCNCAVCLSYCAYVHTSFPLRLFQFFAAGRVPREGL